MRPIFALAFFAFIAVAFALPASAFDVTLQKPGANATAAAGDNKFEFNASGKSPLSCSLLVDDAVVLSDIAAYKNLPVLVHATVTAGERIWRVKCTDADGAQNDSETRSLSVTAATATSEASPLAASSPAASSSQATGAIAGFVVTSGAENEENALIASWRANPGRTVKFAALFSNDGSAALNVSLKIVITNDKNASTEESMDEGNTVASLESPSIEIAPNDKRVLQVEWTPNAEGAFVAQASIVSTGASNAAGNGGGETNFGRAYLMLNVVRSANADWLFVLAFACITVLCITVFKTRQNANAIRGGGLN